MTDGKRPTAIDLFCGAGGMSLGFEQAGFDIVTSADVEQIHVRTYSTNFPHSNARRLDLSSASGDQLLAGTRLGRKRPDAVIAGPPCQGFSLIGKRRRDDPRNLLLGELARLICEIRPRYFVVENVAGILAGRASESLENFVHDTTKAGYNVVRPIQVLDAAEFGVPQRRRRVFVLGYARGQAAPSYPQPPYPLGEDGSHEGPTIWDAIGDLPDILNCGYLIESDEYVGPLGSPSPYARVLRGDDRDPGDRARRRPPTGNGLSGCLRTAHSAETIRRFNRTAQGTREQTSRLYRLSKYGLAPTLRAGTGPDRGSFMAPRPIHPLQSRCITVREAARLQSFPDWFQFHETKWHAFRQIGNSVPPRLARAVAQSVFRALHPNRNGA